jgi:hypothetical protein
MMWRSGAIDAWEAGVDALCFNVLDERAPDRHDGSQLILLGVLSPSVKGAERCRFLISPGGLSMGYAEIPCTGTIVKVKPVLELDITVSACEFQTLLALSICGRLKFYRVSFQTPHYNHGLVASATFHTSEPQTKD